MKALPIALGAAGVIAAVAVVGVLTVQSDWFREKVRLRIVAEAEHATGGKVEIGKFGFNWANLTVDINDLVIHGAEDKTQAPLLAVKHASITLQIISLLERNFSVARVQVDAPRAHLMIQPDGKTNLRATNTGGKGSVVDLQIGQFLVRDGVLRIDVAGRPPRTIPWNVRGENLGVQLGYDSKKKVYGGVVGVSPVRLEVAGIEPIDAVLQANVQVEANRLVSSKALVKIGNSQVELDGFLLENFSSPVLTASYKARVAMEDVDRTFDLVNFRHTGNVDVAGAARFVSIDNYLVSGKASGAGLGYGDVRNMSVSATFVGDQKELKVDAIRLAALGGSLRASGTAHDFKRFEVAGTVDGLTAATLTALAGTQRLPWDGVVSGPFHASGNLSERNLHSLVADGDLSIAPVADATPVHGHLTAKFEGATEKVTLQPSWLELRSTRVDFSGVPNQRLDVRARTGDINELRPAFAFPPELRGAGGSFEGSLSGPLANPKIAGHAALSTVLLGDREIDTLTADFSASESGLTIDKSTMQWGGIEADVKGSLGLHAWKPDEHSAIRADVRISKAEVPKLLILAGQPTLPVSGTLGFRGQVAGTAGDPQFAGDFSLTNGQIEGEPFDSITGQSRYTSAGVSQASVTVNAGAKRLLATSTLDHRRVTVHLTSNAIALDQIALVKKFQPDLHGTARLRADATASFSADWKQFTLDDIGGEVNGTALTLGSRNFGDARLTGATKNGVFSGQFTSNAANASIRGDGAVGLSGDYPVTAKVSVSGLKILNVAEVFNPGTRPADPDSQFDGSVEGQATLTGPARFPARMTASIELDKIELHPATTKAQQNMHNFSLANDGPVKLQLANSVVRVESGRFSGPETDLNVSGQIALDQATPLNLRIAGTLNTALARAWEPDLTASGALALNATLHGTFDKPDFSGRAELQNGEFRYAGFSNGLTNAKGVVLFSGARATIQSFTGESGGGTVQATGFASILDGLIAFRVESKARGVRVRYPEGVSSVSDADLTFAGTEDRSEASGKVTVRRITINPKSDAATILATATTPIHTVAANKGFAANVNLDIQVETAVDVVFETSMAQGVQADANLRLRGTVTSPAVLGRINVTHGDIVFFGNKYTISQGTLTFSDPARIAPILNIDLTTKARGVDVTLTVSGAINKLNVSYRSDPPLQFADIVALLATGRSPTTATLAANTGQSPNFQQLNGNALLGQALANPAADRLQRFFGVSRLKIDPQLTGVTGSPEARLTIEQEVTPQLLFTYVSDVSNTSTQLIRVEWSFSKSWGAILSREENGYVSLDFAYRKRFK